MSLPEIPASALPLVSTLLRLIFDVLSAGDDMAKQDNALMAAQASLSRERAHRRFGAR